MAVNDAEGRLRANFGRSVHKPFQIFFSSTLGYDKEFTPPILSEASFLFPFLLSSKSILAHVGSFC